MFRRFTRARIPRFHSYLLGASGTVYFISRLRTIHADHQVTLKLDKKESPPPGKLVAGLPTDTEQILRNHATTYVPDTAGTGVIRFDSAVVPRFVLFVSLLQN